MSWTNTGCVLMKEVVSILHFPNTSKHIPTISQSWQRTGQFKLIDLSILQTRRPSYFSTNQPLIFPPMLDVGEEQGSPILLPPEKTNPKDLSAIRVAQFQANIVTSSVSPRMGQTRELCWFENGDGRSQFQRFRNLPRYNSGSLRKPPEIGCPFIWKENYRGFYWRQRHRSRRQYFYTQWRPQAQFWHVCAALNGASWINTWPRLETQGLLFHGRFEEPAFSAFGAQYLKPPCGNPMRRLEWQTSRCKIILFSMLGERGAWRGIFYPELMDIIFAFLLDDYFNIAE